MENRPEPFLADSLADSMGLSEQASERALSSGNRATPLVVHPILDTRPLQDSKGRKHRPVRHGPHGTEIGIRRRADPDLPPETITKQSPVHVGSGSSAAEKRPELKAKRDSDPKALPSVDASSRATLKTPRDLRALVREPMRIEGFRASSLPNIPANLQKALPSMRAVPWKWLVVVALVVGLLLGGFLWKVLLQAR